MPAFDLKVMKTTFTNGKLEKDFNWFEKLESMFLEATSFEFDIAIIGCGSYGLPLAAKLKRHGKQAIHLVLRKCFLALREKDGLKILFLENYSMIIGFIRL